MRMVYQMKNSATNSLEVSVIVPTYNRPQALDMVLSALGEQDYPRFEVIVADDGSEAATAELIAEHAGRFGRPLHHVWQPDNGFRLSEIRNKALAQATGDYIVSLDGDCVPCQNYLSHHAALAAPARFVTGHVTWLSQAFTQDVLANRIPVQRSTLKDWVWMYRTKRINRLRPYFTLPDGPWRHMRKRLVRALYGGNMGAWRHGLEAVNGWDERYQGWGCEDHDLAVRLINAGIFRKDGRYAMPVMHLWHPRVDRSRLEHNRRLVQMALESGATRAVKGLDQYMPQRDENLSAAESSDETTSQRS